jgi:hypothetical protein
MWTQGPNVDPAPIPPPEWTAPSGPYSEAAHQRSTSIRRRRRLVTWLVAGALAIGLVAGLVLAYVPLGSSGSARLTYAGKKITNAPATLKNAEAIVARLVHDRHGVAAADSRCYFAAPDQPAPGAKRSDIDRILFCGRVLFIAGDPAATYLSFNLTTVGGPGGFTLSLLALPLSQTPDRAPIGVHLVRPDQLVPAAKPSALRPPPTPAAAPNAFVRANLNGVDLPLAPDTASMGSKTGGVSIYALGRPPSYGVGDDTRLPAPGQQFIAFRTTAAAGDNGKQPVDLSAETTVSVEHGPERALPTGTGFNYILSVPRSVTAVDLVFRDSGWVQTLSLLDGSPGPDNIEVLGRPNRYGSPSNGAVYPISESFTPAVEFGNGVVGTHDTGTVTVANMSLTYQQVVDTKTFTASSTKTALLYIDLRLKLSNDTEKSIEAGLLSFTPDGGTPLAVKNLGDEPNYTYNSVEVPAGLTAGTLTITGSTIDNYAGSADTYRVTVPTTVSIPVKFPILG